MESLLKTEEGQVSFTAHMEDEYSVENIEFYNATGEFQEHSTATFMGRVAPEELMAQGVAILELYVKSSAEKEVNISAGKQAAIVAAFRVSSKGPGIPRVNAGSSGRTSAANAATILESSPAARKIPIGRSDRHWRWTLVRSASST